MDWTTLSEQKDLILEMGSKWLCAIVNIPSTVNQAQAHFDGDAMQTPPGTPRIYGFGFIAHAGT
jgi:hypothetical protein